MIKRIYLYCPVVTEKSTNLSVKLNLVRTNLNYRLSSPPLKKISISLYAPMTSMNVMLDFICMGPVELTGAPEQAKITKWKIVVHSGIRTLTMPGSPNLRVHRISLNINSILHDKQSDI